MSGRFKYLMSTRSTNDSLHKKYSTEFHFHFLVVIGRLCSSNVFKTVHNVVRYQNYVDVAQENCLE